MNKTTILKQYLLTKFFRKFHTREEVLNYQNKKIKQHLQFVINHSPFYKSFYKDYQREVNDNKWHMLPKIDKTMMMNNFDRFNTVGIKKDEAFNIAIEAEKTRNFSPKIGNISIGLSSGTSGNRGIFLVSDKEAALWAGTVLAKLLPGSLLAKHKIAFFLRANSNLYNSTNTGSISFDFYDLLDEFSVHIQKLNTWKPTIVIGPPSMLRKIAEWQQQGIIDIFPQKLVSVAEVLEDIDKIFIESVFHQVLHQVYQCTEGFLASTCPHGTLHINEDIVAIQKEYLHKDKGVFVPIITDFSRTTQPIIRYRLNDLLVERKTPCPCGSPFLALERIDGRCDDLFYGEKESNRDLVTIFPDFVRRAIMFSSNDIMEYKVIQKALSELEVKLKLKNNIEPAKEKVIIEIHKMWKQLGCITPNIVFSDYDLVPSDKKLKRIESRLKPEIIEKFVSK
ncbi:adenylate cyclase [Bacillaceae bacterium Marseille-Q3522]|nr:adenylate cyclase [Bacillaceae bacterium Marseille-Q3522]